MAKNALSHKTFQLKDISSSKKFAQNIANRLKIGDILGLSGELGSGKTFICREIIRSICQEDVSVASPTFNLLQIYNAPNFLIYHFDLYRLKDISEIYELGIEEAIQNGITLIEWPEIIIPILPESTIYLKIRIESETERAVSISETKIY